MVALRAAAVQALVGFLDWYQILVIFFPFPVPAALSGLGLGCFILSLAVTDFL